jgi:DNA-directed RNA polymerase
LQHFAALSGNTPLAGLVNLEPSDTLADVYQAVADRLLELVIDAADHSNGDERRNANLWLRAIGREKAPRSLSKRVVMATPYGGSHKTALDETRAYLDDVDPRRLEWGGDVPTDRDESKLVGWLSTKLKQAH